MTLGCPLSGYPLHRSPPGRSHGRPFFFAWARGERQLVMPGQELGEIRRRKRLLKSLTRASKEQTMRV